MTWFRRAARSGPAPGGHEFSFDGPPEPRISRCSGCEEVHEGVTGFVLDRDRPHAVYHADWSPHTDETWLVLNDELLDHRVHHLPMAPSDEETAS